MITFTVPGPPRSKQRPRVFLHKQSGRILAMTPKATKEYEERIRDCFREATKRDAVRFPKSGNIILLVSCFFKPSTKMIGEMKKQGVVSGMTAYSVNWEALPAMDVRDWDNLGKIVSDALNGVAWDDDRQVTDAFVIKRYSMDPRVTVSIG